MNRRQFVAFLIYNGFFRYDLLANETDALKDYFTKYSYLFNKDSPPIHSFTKLKNGNLLAIPKKDSTIRVISKETLKDLLHIKPLESKGVFYGHGCIYKDKVFLSESSYNKKVGLVSVRDSSGTKILTHIQFPNFQPHDLTCDKDTLYIVGKGKNAGIYQYDLKNMQQLSFLPLPKKNEFPRHIKKLKENTFIVLPMTARGSQNHQCAPYLLEGKSLTAMAIPKEYQTHHVGQILNAHYIPTEESIYTICPSGAIFKWNAKTLKLEKYNSQYGIVDIHYDPSTKSLFGHNYLNDTIYKINPSTLATEVHMKFKNKIFDIAHLAASDYFK